MAENDESVGIESLRYRYLDDEEIAHVVSEYPEVRDARWCPDCGGSGELNGSPCDCELARQAFKHYALAGIGVTYMRLSWKDYRYGDSGVKRFCREYVRKADSFRLNNMGLMLLGSSGIGKTMAVSLLVKDLILEGYKPYFTTYSNLVQMMGDGFYDEESRRWFVRQILRSPFLAIDDIGKEFGNRLSANAIDNVLRERVQHGRPTFVTSNLSRKEILDTYGSASFSMLMEACNVMEIDIDEDVRPKVKKQRLSQARRGIVSPIV